MRVSIKTSQAVLAPSPLAPLPRWGEGNRSLSSFPKDGEITTAFCNA